MIFNSSPLWNYSSKDPRGSTGTSAHLYWYFLIYLYPQQIPFCYIIHNLVCDPQLFIIKSAKYGSTPSPWCLVQKSVARGHLPILLTFLNSKRANILRMYIVVFRYSGCKLFLNKKPLTSIQTSLLVSFDPFLDKMLYMYDAVQKCHSSAAAVAEDRRLFTLPTS